MSEADLEYAATPEDAEYEHTDIEPAIAGRFAVWLAIAMVISGGIVYGTFWLFEGRSQALDRRTQQFPLAAGQELQPPTPRLQTQPFRDVHLLTRGQLEQLDGYGWVDQSAGVVRIPIDEAMRIVSERAGILPRGQSPGGSNPVAQDSSAGRTMAGR